MKNASEWFDGWGALHERRTTPLDWQQLELQGTNATQRTYELIRPVVLFGQSPTERA